MSTEGKICFYEVSELRKFHLEIGNAKPVKQIKSKSRFLCLAINHLRPQVVKAEKKKTKAIKKKKQLGKRNKDEKLILKRQKKSGKQ